MESTIENLAKDYAKLDRNIKIDKDTRYFKDKECEIYDAFMAGYNVNPKDLINYNESEVKRLLMNILDEVDVIVTTHGQRDGFVEINYDEFNKWFNDNKKK